jgi:hypothetical protein
MSLDSDLCALLKTICPRAFPDVAPVATVRPYVTYQQIGGRVTNYVDNTVPSSENAEFQINVWSATRKEAKLIALQIEAALISANAFQARPVAAARSDYEPDMEIYGSLQDFSIWANR